MSAEFSNLTRDKSFILSNLVIPEDPTQPVITRKPMKVVFPQRYVDRGMATLGSETSFTGIFATICENRYSVTKACAMVFSDPVSSRTLNWLGKEYVELSYDEGSAYMTTRDLVKHDQLVYRIYDEFFNKGNIPWFMTYDDVAHIFDTANKHGGTSIADSKEVTHFIVSLISRTRGDLTQYFRTAIETREDLKSIQPAFIAMINAAYAPTNTLNRIAGSYFDEGTVASIVYPTDRVEKLESAYRAGKTS